MKLVYGVKDRPKLGRLIVFAIQQLLAIMAATLVVPVITNNTTGSEMSPAAALLGAGVGTLVYVLFTKAKSPVFLGSSFAFLGSMAAAFAGASTMALGYLGLILGAVFAGLVYVVIAIIVKLVGVKWVNKLMPAVVIGPTVSIIGLSLAGNAINDLQTANAGGDKLIAVLCGLVTLADRIDLADLKKLRSLLVILAKHTAIDYERKQKNSVTDENISENLCGSLAEDGRTPDEALLDHEAYERLLASIDKLGDAYTPIFQLKYLHGYSNPEIAKLLNIPSARLVSHRLGNGKMILMKMIGGDRYFENKSR